MSLRDLRENFKYDADFIYEGLRLDASYYLKQLMLEKGLNKKQLAERMGVSPAYITKIFSGENISLRTIAKVLSALEVEGGLRIIDRDRIKQKLKTYENKKLFKVIKKNKRGDNESDFISIAA
jgi:transcriptional regulator with XRE-family HTH domain